MACPSWRSVVNLMNGTIDVKSKLGEGTTFTVTVYMKLRDGDDQDLTPLEGLRVLVADDEEAAAESACEVLKSIGMEPDYVLSARMPLRRCAVRSRMSAAT